MKARCKFGAALLTAALLALAAWYVRAGRLVRPADVRPGPRRGPHPPLTKRPHPMDEIGQGQKVSFDKCSPLLYRR